MLAPLFLAGDGVSAPATEMPAHAWQHLWTNMHRAWAFWGGLKRPQESRGSHWSVCGQGDGCFLASHLKAHNSEAAGIVGGCNDRHQVGALGDVLIVELDGHLVVTCWERKPHHFRDSGKVLPEWPCLLWLKCPQREDSLS